MQTLTPCCQIYRVTEEPNVAESAVWPIPFLMKIYSAIRAINVLVPTKSGNLTGEPSYFVIPDRTRTSIMWRYKSASWNILRSGVYLYAFETFPVYFVVISQQMEILLLKSNTKKCQVVYSMEHWMRILMYGIFVFYPYLWNIIHKILHTFDEHTGSICRFLWSCLQHHNR